MQLTLIALGTVSTALAGVSLSGIGITAVIWLAIGQHVGRALPRRAGGGADQRPATVDDVSGLAAMTKNDATLSGLVKGWYAAGRGRRGSGAQ